MIFYKIVLGAYETRRKGVDKNLLTTGETGMSSQEEADIALI